MPKVINLKVDTYDELRDALPKSGLFDIFDCDVLLKCSPDTPDDEIDKMFGLIKSTINVVKTRVVSQSDLDLEDEYEDDSNIYIYNFQISEVQYRNHQGKFNR